MATDIKKIMSEIDELLAKDKHSSAGPREIRRATTNPQLTPALRDAILRVRAMPPSNRNFENPAYREVSLTLWSNLRNMNQLLPYDNLQDVIDSVINAGYSF